ncbi:8976_t:CDS:2, partial [Racocetra fulgida]
DKNVPTLTEAVKELKPNDLIEFLRREKDLQLDEDDLFSSRKPYVGEPDFTCYHNNDLVMVFEVKRKHILKEMGERTLPELYITNDKAKMVIRQIYGYMVKNRLQYDQQENQIFIDQLQEKGKKHKKITRPLDKKDDNHLYKHQCQDEGLLDLIEVLDDEELFVEWKFDTLKPNWLDKIVHEHDSLIYIAFNCNNKMT